MIGNDIVDLNQARRESNWRRKGFLDKVFTPHEQQLIASATDPDVMVWTLWSMKESAYKLIVRETGQRFFNPQKLVCQLDQVHCAGNSGRVFYHKNYHTQSIITTRYVASVAFATDSPFRHEIILFDQTGYQHQHEKIREAIKQYYAAHFSFSENNVDIQKSDAGIPTLSLCTAEGHTTQKPISLSHHGHYGAFVL